MTETYRAQMLSQRHAQDLKIIEFYGIWISEVVFSDDTEIYKSWETVESLTQEAFLLRDTTVPLH